MLILIATAVRLPYARQADKVTNQDFVRILDDGQAAEVAIHQNPQTPTGEVVITLTDGQVKRLYVTDVKDTQKLLEDHQMEYVVMDVPQENYLVTIILPFMLSIVVVVIIIMVMNRSAGGGGANARMMNFGKSRARMSRDSKVNFSNVAGLVEEKEELEEVVDFLKNPQKYTLSLIHICICSKMVRRHPHVFGNVKINSVEEGTALWNQIKMQEKAKKP